MALTIALIVMATVMLAGLELWLFWRIGERDDRRRYRYASNNLWSEPPPRVRPRRGAAVPEHRNQMVNATASDPRLLKDAA